MTDSWTELSSKTSNTENEEACSNELTMLDYLLKQIRFAIWKNTFGTLEKYIWKFGQILLVFWTNILKISTNIFSNHALYCTFLFCHRGIMSDLKWDYTLILY